MATFIHSSRSCLPPFYTIPIFPLLNRKIFHLLVQYAAVSYLFMCEVVGGRRCMSERRREGKEVGGGGGGGGGGE